MTLNIIEAADLIDNTLGQDDIDFLLAARQGVALHDVPDHQIKVMKEHDLVDILPFDHPRASNAIMGVVPNERGVKLLNVLDDRRRDADNLAIYEDPTVDIQSEAVQNAQSVQADQAPGEGIPADDPRNVNPDQVAADQDPDLPAEDENSGRDGSEEPDRVRRGKDKNKNRG